MKIRNRAAVLGIKSSQANLTFLRNGKELMTVQLTDFQIGAGDSALFNLKPYLPEMKDRAEYIGEIVFCLKKDNNWKVTGEHFEIRFNKSNGALDCYLAQGDTIIKEPLLPNFTRPLTDNDKRGWKPHKKLKQWYETSCRLTSMTCEKVEDNRVIISSDYTIIEGKAEVKISYLVYADGVVRVDYHLAIKESLPNIPKVGMTCGINDQFREVQWYGKGPWENYADKCSGAEVGIYKLPIDKFMEPYVKPQENGNRTGVRWMHLSNGTKGIMIITDSLLSMSAWPYTAEMIQKAKHTNELKEAGFITLNIDLKQMGVGGNDSWSDVAAPLEKYQIPARNYKYTFWIKPISHFDSDKIYN